MTGVRPDVTKLSLHNESFPASGSSSPRLRAQSPVAGETTRSTPLAGSPASKPAQKAGSSPQSTSLPPNEPGPHWRVRNSTLGEQYAAAKSDKRAAARHASPPTAQPSKPEHHVQQQSQQPPAQTDSQHQHHHHHHQHHQQSPKHLKPAESFASVSSLASQRSAKSGRPASSVVELKRFFGKGRTKHDKPDNSDSKKDSNKKSDRGFFGLFRQKVKRDTKKKNMFDLNDSGALASPKAHTGPPAELDPNFVVHEPDYESWDPFHIFGLEEGEDDVAGDAATERLPFLESGITKYGEMGRDMGSGAGGNVRMMERPSDHKVFAVKEFRARKTNETVLKYAKHVTAEYALGAAFHHKNIIETIDLIKEGDKYYEVMEYGPNDFFSLVMSASMTTPQINSAFHQIVSGVCYLHSMGVAHRDLKLDNCVVTTEGIVKLIDFGSAVVFKYPTSPQIHLARGIMGSDPYLAPEVFERRPYQPQCADIWSCGIIYCCTYLRRFPWKLPQLEDPSFKKFVENPANIDGAHPPQNNQRKITGPWRLLRLLPVFVRPIITHILSVNVEKRATMDDILKDAWFSEVTEISVLPPSESHVHTPGGANHIAAHA